MLLRRPCRLLRRHPGLQDLRRASPRVPRSPHLGGGGGRGRRPRDGEGGGGGRMSVPLIVHAQGDSPFDKIRRFRPDGVEYWSARELMPYLGYASWQKMEGVVERARLSCVKQG